MIGTIGVICHSAVSVPSLSCFPSAAEKQYSQQARLLEQEEELEADGEEDDDEDDEQDDSWSRRRGAPEGRPEPKGQNFSDEALRRRVVGSREDDEDDEEDA